MEFKNSMVKYNTEKIKKNNKNLDAFIGEKLKRRRLFLGMSQDKLASHLGITFQQIQKYEKGVNRISASMLYTMANILSVDLQYFVDGYFENKLENNNIENLHEKSDNKLKAISYAMKRVERIGIENIRKSRLKRLEQEKQEWKDLFDKNSNVVPSVKLIMTVRIDG